MSNKPAMNFRSPISYAVSLAVWKNSKGYSYTMQKRWKNKDTDEYENSNYFFASDLAAMAHCIDQALTWTAENPITRENGTTPSVDSNPTKEAEQDELPF